MPACILRVCGSTSKVQKFLATSSLQPDRIFWKGEPGNPASRVIIRVSGFNIRLARADSLAAQAAKATAFIRKHKQDLLLIPKLRFLGASIDFMVYDLATEDRPWSCYDVPRPLVLLAGELGCSIVLSFYGKPPEQAGCAQRGRQSTATFKACRPTCGRPAYA